MSHDDRNYGGLQIPCVGVCLQNYFFMAAIFCEIWLLICFKTQMFSREFLMFHLDIQESVESSYVKAIDVWMGTCTGNIFENCGDVF